MDTGPSIQGPIMVLHFCILLRVRGRSGCVADGSQATRRCLISKRKVPHSPTNRSGENGDVPVRGGSWPSAGLYQINFVLILFSSTSSSIEELLECYLDGGSSAYQEHEYRDEQIDRACQSSLPQRLTGCISTESHLPTLPILQKMLQPNHTKSQQHYNEQGISM